jgi:restriction system protein
MSTYTQYQVEVRHDGLNKYRRIKGTDELVVQRMAQAQINAWNEMWWRKQAAEETRAARKKAVQAKEAKKNLAVERTKEAQEAISGVEKTLHWALDIDDRIDWDDLLDKTTFPTPRPSQPKLMDFPKEPMATDRQFIPVRKWYFSFFNGPRQKAENEAKHRFMAAHDSWIKAIAQVQSQNKTLEEEYARNVKRWEKEERDYQCNQAQKNDRVLEKKKAYFAQDRQSFIEYCDMALSTSKYPDTFPQEWNLEYLDETKTLAIDYFLPSPADIPALKEVKYIASKDEFVEVHLQEAAINRLYDSLLYQITLRTIHEIFESDQVNAVAAVVFNGWVRSNDKGTGKPITVCVLSIQTCVSEFQAIDLRNVDPKLCFKALKGVGSSKLHGLSPIAPILQLNKEDKRFVSSYSVVGDVDQSTNLAAMDWEDFEHLIREVFEKEFSQNGGEVKITQASRDRGVDAIAFDPDPLRGGKIVIQAKRYTNTVGVSAVRDLYGTVVNEGATKGILVTTADYGPDAYAFAREKPLTLLSGSNLLHLLEKHGHKATIDLKAAKQLLADEKRAEGSDQNIA